MLFNVPQFIEIEDKIIGPLTAKQLGWIAMGGIISLILWNVVDGAAFIVAVVINAAVFGALAFYRPYNQPLVNFIMSSFHFTMKPKVYVWRRSYDNMNIRKAAPKPKMEKVFQKKTLDSQKIREISKILDNKQGTMNKDQ